MRIGLPAQTIPAYVPPVPGVPLSPEVSRALIASGIFQPGSDKVGWASLAPGAASPPVGQPDSVAPVILPGGTRLRPMPASTSNDVLLPALLSAAEQSLPIVEQCGSDVVADAVGFLVGVARHFTRWPSMMTSSNRRFFSSTQPTPCGCSML